MLHAVNASIREQRIFLKLQITDSDTRHSECPWKTLSWYVQRVYIYIMERRRNFPRLQSVRFIQYSQDETQIVFVGIRSTAIKLSSTKRFKKSREDSANSKISATSRGSRWSLWILLQSLNTAIIIPWKIVSPSWNSSLFTFRSSSIPIVPALFRRCGSREKRTAVGPICGRDALIITCRNNRNRILIATLMPR